ncbi:MAG: transcriptional regulator [Bacteroidetes bacterium]|nr:transcriptional regulator [Bacteroidota bacterium]
MATLKYKIIKSKSQYNGYCKTLEGLLENKAKNKTVKEEIELLTLLVGKWDKEHHTFEDLDPVELLWSLMEDHQLKAKDLVEILQVSKGLVSDILNYKKGLSKEMIRTLSGYFKISQEALNRTYQLVSPANSHLRNASARNTTKGRPYAK